MFDFEKFPVYQLSEKVYQVFLNKVISKRNIDLTIKDQLKRASMSIISNIAEGAGKYSKKDKRNFYVIARGSVNECVALIRIIKLEGKISEEFYGDLYKNLLTIGKMLSGLIKKMND